MHVPLVHFFKTIHQVITQRDFLFYKVQQESLFKTVVYVVVLALLATALTASIREARIQRDFPSQFVETFGELELCNGKIVSGISGKRQVLRRDIALLTSTFFGIAVPPSEVPVVVLTDSLLDTLKEATVQFTPTKYGFTQPRHSTKSDSTYYVTQSFTWKSLGLNGQHVTLSESYLSSLFRQRKISLFFTLWALFLFLLATMMISYLFLLFIIVLFYSRKDPILSRGTIRLKLVLYLSTPYFILFPLFAIVQDGLGEVSSFALIASSILLIRLSNFRRAQLLQRGVESGQ